jgi:hypothetical protein
MKDGIKRKFREAYLNYRPFFHNFIRKFCITIKFKAMMYGLQEIENYLKKCISIRDAIDNLSDESIVNANPADYSKTYQQTDENLPKYEEQIGMTELKNYHLELRRNSNGTKGKYWMALSPHWDSEKSFSTPSKYAIRYWVNYGDHKTYGWFTVEQIKEWLNIPDLELHTLGGTKEK